MSYIADVIAGKATLDEIDDYIEYWHTHADVLGRLHDHLGMTWDEYRHWVAHPDSLEEVVAARRATEEITRQATDAGLVDLGQDWLRAPPVAMCDRCRRQTWAKEDVGIIDSMPQPDGGICGGTLRPIE